MEAHPNRPGTRPAERRRAAGVLLHPTSLPGDGGIGDLGAAAHRFVDWLAAAGQSVWQVLPLNQTGYGASPYGAVSSFAGNRLLIDLGELVGLGLMAAPELPAPPPATPHRVDYPAVEGWKDETLRLAWERFEHRAAAEVTAELAEFAAGSAGWLDDWALYAALKRELGGAWSDWPPALRRREPAALADARSRLASEIAFEVFVQYLFHRQWSALRRAARGRGVRLLGDLPIYPAPDSADVWAHQELFDLDDEGRPNASAGVPPDYFSPRGQLWGNPLYRWRRMADDGFGWWIRRVDFALARVDELRLDHFRGFAAYWRVPAGAEDATAGRWVEAPGAALFETLRAELGALPLVAEDLGVITPDVEALRRRFGLSGMKVLQFAFDEVDSEHLPHHHHRDSIVYTGTHDNDTTRGWYASLTAEARGRLEDYLGPAGDEIHWSLARAAHRSVGRLAVVPAQDLLGLDGAARMNTPGRSDDNWRWKLEAEDLGERLASRLRRLTELSGRLAADDEERTAATGDGD